MQHYYSLWCLVFGGLAALNCESRRSVRSLNNCLGCVMAISIDVGCGGGGGL